MFVSHRRKFDLPHDELIAERITHVELLLAVFEEYKPNEPALLEQPTPEFGRHDLV